MITIKNLDKLKNLTKGEMNVLVELLKLSDDENNVFFHNDERETISKTLNISKNSLVKSILSLQKNKELIIKRNDFYYILNKSVFMSGY